MAVSPAVCKIWYEPPHTRVPALDLFAGPMHRVKDPLRVGLTDEGRNMVGRAGRWISRKSEAQRGRILVGVVKKRRQILIVQQR